MFETRMTEYLQAPLQILWFDSHEMAFLVVCYLFAMLFGGAMWIVSIVAPFIIIPYKRSKQRGFFGHLLFAIGHVKIYGYPDPSEKKFHE